MEAGHEEELIPRPRVPTLSSAAVRKVRALKETLLEPGAPADQPLGVGSSTQARDRR